MISWIVIGILIVAGIFAIKLNHLKHRFFVIILILLALFLYTSMNLVTEKNSLDLTTSEGFFNAVKVYTGWLGNGFQNLKSLTGRAIGMDWKSTNGTFIGKSKSKR